MQGLHYHFLHRHGLFHLLHRHCYHLPLHSGKNSHRRSPELLQNQDHLIRIFLLHPHICRQSHLRSYPMPYHKPPDKLRRRHYQSFHPVLFLPYQDNTASHLLWFQSRWLKAVPHLLSCSARNAHPQAYILSHHPPRQKAYSHLRHTYRKQNRSLE